MLTSRFTTKFLFPSPLKPINSILPEYQNTNTDSLSTPKPRNLVSIDKPRLMYRIHFLHQFSLLQPAKSILTSVKFINRFAKMPLKVCANLSFMYQETSSLLERYNLAKQSSFTAVECAFPYDFSVSEVQEAKEKNTLEQVLINVYPGNFAAGELGFAAIPGKETEFVKSLELAVTYAKALKCSIIHIMAGVVPSPTEVNDKTYISNLSHAAKILQKEQIIGVIEPINSVSAPNYYLNSFEKAISILKEVNSPNLRLQLDIFHLQFISGNLTNNIKKYLPYTAHIQIAQVPHRHEPDISGEIDYNYVFTLLKELQYSGWIGLEYKPISNTKDGLKWLKML